LRAEYSAAVAQALGFVGAPTNDANDLVVIKALEELVDDAKSGARLQALAALGRIAGRTGDMGIVERIGELLVRQVERENGEERVWAGFALGLAGTEIRSRGERVPEGWIKCLDRALATARHPDQFAAFAVASALCEMRSVGS